MPGGIRSARRARANAPFSPHWFVLLTLAGVGNGEALVAAEPARPADRLAVERFDKVIAPLFAQRCLDCHNAAARKGALDLSRHETAIAGGDGGPVIVPGNAADSVLWQRIDAGEMPPGKPLPAAERDLLKGWIEAGAVWGSEKIDPFRYTTERRGGLDWWSLQPLSSPAIPAVRQSDWPRGPIDAFILAELERKNLAPSAAADRRTLIRRVHFDVIGLPPEPAEVDDVVADTSPRAYEDLIDRLLGSRAYGERWGRHWLDVVRFGESNGFERDKLRPNSWRYRDWVVQAFNRDLPYDEFVRMQLAGDVLSPNDPLAVAATGFLVAAPWDEVGQTQQSAAMRAVVRQEELEELVGTVGQTFLGLTANCARCHDHKFDPISQAEYYRLTAALGGVQHGERECVIAAGKDAADARRLELDRKLAELNSNLAEIDDPVREKILQTRSGLPQPSREPPRPIARWEFDQDFRDQIGSLHGTPHGGAKLERGYLQLDGTSGYVVTSPLKNDLEAKTLEVWVRLSDLKQSGGGVMTVQSSDGATFDSIVYGERSPGRWLAGSDHFSRTGTPETDPEKTADKELVHVAIVYGADHTITTYRNGELYSEPYKAKGLVRFAAGTTQIAFGLRHSPASGNRLLAGAIDKAQLYDRALSAEEVAASAKVMGTGNEPTEQEILAQLPTELKAERNALVLAISELETERRFWAGGPAYAVAPRQPATAHVLERGNPATPKEVVSPAGIAALATLSPDFRLPPDAPDAERRIKLAEWITDSRNPLTARVIVNRLWHYHFGTGIVDTPNDLGFNGGRPSHPVLLDWLAGELIHGKWSLKHIQRSILLSATYRQSSRFDPTAAKVDVDDRLLWRMPPRRLEAEALRDAVLSVAGELNPRMGGPGYRDFTTYVHNSQFYRNIDPVGAEFNRRSLYRTWVRSGRSPLLDVLDCPDPSTAAPKRAVTTTPLQALSLFNNSFMLRMSDKFAERIEAIAGKEPERQVDYAYVRAYARPATRDERTTAARFIVDHGLPAFCRVVFNSNEFLQID